MRKKSQSPNAMMESLHLKRFADEGSRLATAAAEAAAAEKAMKESKRAAFRDSERTKLTAARNDKANRLDRDEAVHAAIIKHQVRHEHLWNVYSSAELSRSPNLSWSSAGLTY